MNFEEGIGSQPSQPSQQSQKSDIDDWLDWEKPPSFKAAKCSLATTYPAKLSLPRSTQTTTNNNSNVDSGFDSSPSPCQSRTQFTKQSNSVENENSTSSQELNASTRKRSTDDVDSAFSFSHSSTSSQWSSAVTKRPTQKTISNHQLNLPTNATPFSQSITSASCSSNDTFGESLSSIHLDTYSPDEEFNEPDGQDYGQIDETNDLETFRIEDSSEEEDLSSRSVENWNDRGQPIINPDGGIPGSILPKIQPILNLFTQVKSQYSDCAFVYGLAAHMCKDIYPKNYNISLKTALLLSIVSCNVSVNHFHCLRFK